MVSSLYFPFLGRLNLLLNGEELRTYASPRPADASPSYTRGQKLPHREAAVVLSRRHESRRDSPHSRAGAATAHASSDGGRLARGGGRGRHGRPGGDTSAVSARLRRRPTPEVTIFDPAAPGTSLGATAVGAGLLHPLSPRGKLMGGRARSHARLGGGGTGAFGQREWAQCEQQQQAQQQERRRNTNP